MTKLKYLIPLIIFSFACNDPDTVEMNNIPNNDGLPRVNKSITKAETYFDLTIGNANLYKETNDSIFELIDPNYPDLVITNGENIDTNWDSELGIITFSSENDESTPYPTVTILYDTSTGDTVNIEQATFAYTVTEVGISLQDVLIGTAEELNARTYIYPYQLKLQEPKLLIIEVGNNYIRGGVIGKVVKRLFEQGKFTGEIVLAEFVTNFRICTGC